MTTSEQQAVPVAKEDEFATVEAWEHDDQRELSSLYNHRADDSLQFNRGQMRTAIRHGKSLASLPCKSGEGEAPGYAGLGNQNLSWRLLGLGAGLRAEDWDEDHSAAQDVEEAARRLVTPDATQTREAEGGLAAFGAAMFQRIWDSFTDDGWDIEINDLVTVEAVKAGLVSVTPYDPEVHSDGSGAAESGDDFYEVTPAGRAALNARGDA